MSTLALIWDLVAVDNASGTFRKVGAEADVASGSIKGLAAALGAAAFGVAVGEAVKKAADFQSAMLLIRTQAQDTTDNLGQFSDAILKMAGETAQAPEALANSLYHVTSTGIRGAQALDEVRAAAELATVAHANLEETTNALTGVMASGIPGVNSFTEAVGVLNATVGSGDMKMSDLNEALSTGVLQNMKGYGLSIQDVGAALATFGDVNVRGAEAATQLRMAVQAMAVPIRGGQQVLDELGITTADVSNGMAKIHLSASQLADDMQHGGLNAAVKDLYQHLLDAGFSTTQFGDILTEVFGKRAGPGLANLLQQFDRLQSKYADINKAQGDFGRTWDETTQTAKFAFDSLKQSLSALAIELGSDLLPPLADAAKWLSQHETLIKNIVIGLAGLTAGLLVYKTTVLAVKAATEAWDAVQALLDAELDANPIGIVVTALAALVAGIIYAYNHSETFRRILQDIGKALGNLVDALKWAAGEVEKIVGRIVGAFEEMGRQVGKALDNTGQIFKSWAIGLFDDWKGPGSGEAVFAQIKQQVGEMPKAFGILRDQAPNILRQMWAQIKQDFHNGTSGGQGFFDDAKKGLGLLREDFDKTNQTMGHSFQETWRGIHDFWRDYVEPFFTLAGDMTGKISRIISASFDDVKKAFTGAWDAITSHFHGSGGGEETLNKAQQKGQETDSVLRGAFQDVQFAWDSMTGGLRRAWDSIAVPLINDFRAAWDSARQFFEQVAGSIASGFQNALNGVQGAVDWVIHNVIDDILIDGFNELAADVGSSARIKRIKFATGGYTGDGGKYDPAGIVHAGEFVFTKEQTAKMGVGNMYALADMLSGFSGGGYVPGGLPGYAGGGLVTNLLSAVTDPVGFFTGLINGGGSGPGGSVGQILSGIPSMALHAAEDWLKKLVASYTAALAGGGGGGGAQQWAGVALQALNMEGYDASPLPSLLRRMNQESGGNPAAVNLWDSNAAAGTPSVGLMQVIGPTYQSHKDPRADNPPFAYGVSEDPLSNIAAAIRYTAAAYGSLQAGWDRAGGYDTGGWLLPGTTRAFNGTGRPERIRTAEQEAAVQRALAGQPIVMHLFDVDNHLIGTVRGHAADVTSAALGAIHDRGMYG